MQFFVLDVIFYILFVLNHFWKLLLFSEKNAMQIDKPLSFTSIFKKNAVQQILTVEQHDYFEHFLKLSSSKCTHWANSK